VTDISAVPGTLRSLLRDFSIALLVVLLAQLAAPGQLLPEVGVAAALWLLRGPYGLIAAALGISAAFALAPPTLPPGVERLTGAAVGIVAVFWLLRDRRAELEFGQSVAVLLRISGAALAAATASVLIATRGPPADAMSLAVMAPVATLVALWGSAWLAAPPLLWLAGPHAPKTARSVGMGLLVAACLLALVGHMLGRSPLLASSLVLPAIVVSQVIALLIATTGTVTPLRVAAALLIAGLTPAVWLQLMAAPADPMIPASIIAIAGVICALCWTTLLHRNAPADASEYPSPARLALFESTMRSLPIGIVHVDLDGSIRYANDMIDALLGERTDVFSMYGRVDPSQQRLLRQSWQRFIEGDHAFDEAVALQSQGRSRWLNVKVEKAFHDGVHTGYTGTLTDITNEKRHEEARHRSEAQSRAVLDNAVDAIITITRAGEILTFNRSAQRIFQWRAEEVIGRNVNVLMPEPYRSQHDRYIDGYLDTGDAKIIGIGRELVGQRKDGFIFPMYLAVSEVVIDDVVTFTGIIRDIRREKAAQEEIRRQNEQLQVTLQNAPLGMVSYRFGMPFTSTNRAFQNLLGYPPPDLAAMTFEQIVHEEDRAELTRLVDAARTNRLQQFTLRLRLLRHDAEAIHVISHNAVTHDEFGHPEMIIAQIEDMTAQIEAEESARLQQEKLTHVARLSTLGEMTAGIAHEINQPLTAIALYARTGVRMLDGGTADQNRLKDLLQKLNDQSLRAGEVIDRMQALVRNSDSERQASDMNDLIHGILRLCESDARVNDIGIVLDLAPALPAVIADPVQLQQVLLNLVRNAIDSMTEVGCPHGNSVRIQTLVPRRGFVEVRVFDTGTGVSDSFAERLFTPFATTKTTGMGMGLSICRSIITSHGGTLGFYNNPDAGATFYFQLPTETETADEYE
jgi:two-component system, LuxR family, sensor kinase FixL